MVTLMDQGLHYEVNGTVAALAPAYVFLASQQSSFVNGETLGVTGGTPCPRATDLYRRLSSLKYREDDTPENVDVFEETSGPW
jgi:hypothetical protein